MKENLARFDSLFDLAETLSQQNDYEEILRLVAQQAASLLQAEVALILMVNPQTQETVKTIVREGQRDDYRPYRVAQDQVTGWLAKMNQSLLTADLKADPRFARVKFGKALVKSVVAVLLKAEGTIIGSLVLLNNKGGGSFGEDDLAFLERLAVIASPYLRNVQRLRHYFEPALPEDALMQKYRDVGLLGRSVPFVQLLHTIEAAARCDVRVLLGKTTSMGDMVLTPRSVEVHAIEITAARPVIDATSTTIGANLSSSDFEALPTERYYLSIVSLLPQANASFLGDDVNIGGATGQENAYFIDGANTTDPFRAIGSTQLPYNFVKEIELKSGGYEAEYGRATGGIVNVVTHGGSNAFQAKALGFSKP